MAAHIYDGSRIRVLLPISVPPGLPMVAVVSALVFLFSWNEFMLASTFVGCVQKHIARGITLGAIK